MRPVVEFRIGDTLRLRKRHPCGGFEWEVVRLGADIGVRCRSCGRRVLLERATLEKRMKTFIERGPEPDVAKNETPAEAAKVNGAADTRDRG